MEEFRVIGHVISVNGLRLKVELSADAKSSSRATPDGVQRAVAINSFLTFDLGAGAYAIGILSDLEARESYDFSRDEELSLELTKPRRTASVQLLGTIRRSKKRSDEKSEKDDWQFDTGITILPTLDTPAEIANPDVLSGLFARPPERNKPQKHEEGKEFDYPLEIGHLTGDENAKVKVSFNDLFSRPLAIVGNTGSGKSYTVASLLSRAIESFDLEEDKKCEPHIFILDINGEYANAFLGKGDAYEREPNKIYLNGKEFCLPAWLMNSEEICDWLQASESVQEPVLKDWWALAKSNSTVQPSSAERPLYDWRQVANIKIDNALNFLDSGHWAAAKNFIHEINMANQYVQLDMPITKTEEKHPKIENDRFCREYLLGIQKSLLTLISEEKVEQKFFSKTADAPHFVRLRDFHNPNLTNRSIDQDNGKQIDSYLSTLKLRLQTRLDDRRWQLVFNFEEQKIMCFKDWMSKLGVGQENGSRVSVLDLSMLSSEVLPFVCAIFGRLLLESREMLSPNVRSERSWLLVLEEAHNYARPSRKDESRGQRLSRQAFERVAKEGRKFGLSLVVASQRPSEISPTIISQCANFFSHRLQNPDDIDHFRKIIPKQAQRLLDQVTVLAAGEAIVFGSAVHVPSRVQIEKPAKEPWSSTASPFIDWKKGEPFPLDEVIENWGLGKTESGDNSQQDDGSGDSKKVDSEGSASRDAI